MTYIIHRIKKILLPKAIFWAILNMVLMFPIIASAVGGGTGGGGMLHNPLGNTTSIAALAQEIAKIAAQIGITVAAIFIIWSGFLYVSARGNEEKLKKAHQTFTWAIIGTLILLGAWVIATAIAQTTCSLGGLNWTSSGCV